MHGNGHSHSDEDTESPPREKVFLNKGATTLMETLSTNKNDNPEPMARFYWAVGMAQLLYHFDHTNANAQAELELLGQVLPPKTTNSVVTKGMEIFTAPRDQKWNFWLEYALRVVVFLDLLETEAKLKLGETTAAAWWHKNMRESHLWLVDESAQGGLRIAKSVKVVMERLELDAVHYKIKPVELVAIEGTGKKRRL